MGASWHRGRLFTVFGVLISAICTLPAHAQNAPKAPSNAWVVNCATSPASQKLKCQMVQNLTDRKSGKTILRAVVRPAPKAQNASGFSMLLALPHGLSLPYGARYSIDGATSVKLPIQTSDPNGVYAAFPLTDKTLGALRAGAVMKVMLQNVQRKPFSMNVSLNGFTAATRKMSRLQEGG